MNKPTDTTDGPVHEQDPKELLNLMVRQATEYALILLNPECLILYWNDGAQRIFGYTEAEMLGRHIKSIFLPDDVELGVSEVEFGRAREIGHSDDDRWHKRKGGARFWATGVVTCFKGPSGEIVGYSKVLRDQTVRKNTDDQIRTNNSDLTQFCYRASHDLNQSLRTIVTYLQLANRTLAKQIGSEEKELIDVSIKAAKHAQSLLADMMSYTEAGKPQTKYELTDLEAVFDNAVANLVRLVDENQAVVTRTSFPTLPAVPIQLVEVFQNLITNAIKYRSQEVPKILAHAEERDDDWLFSVCDNGVGIPSESLEEIFEPFKRLHSHTEVPGSGLGLAIVKRIIENHNGRMWADSQPGHGTRFHFTLPKKPA